MPEGPRRRDTNGSPRRRPHLLDGGEWPDTIARPLGYADAGNLATVLKVLGVRRPSVPGSNRVNFDGLVATSHLTTYERKRGAAV